MFKFFGADISTLLHLLLVDDSETLQILRHLTLFVHLDNLFHSVERDGEEVIGIVLVSVPYQSFENVMLKKKELSETNLV